MCQRGSQPDSVVPTLCGPIVSIAKDVFERILTISPEIGISILIVEQKVNEVLAICNRVYSLKLGKVFFTGTPDTLKHDKVKIKELFL